MSTTQLGSRVQAYATVDHFPPDAFYAIDVNGDGVIDRREWEAGNQRVQVTVESLF